ncbi:protein DpdD [Novacetimonas pomaceti]|uniref:protein DpdD n=1 Tax=Novacetimonas pomaceti TaxID=2021998 RepID=UPI0010582E0E|nr:protein DpdD [Novacetimonas pomaceti]
MIGESLDKAQLLLADIHRLEPWSGVHPSLVKLCEDVAQSVADAAIPGSLVPVMDRLGDLQIDIAASTMSDWRRLKPILVAFAGPTFTDFEGIPKAFHPADPAGQPLLSTNPAVTSIMRLPAEPRARLVALRGVRRALEALKQAPDLQHVAPVPTSLLLLQFQDYLNVKNREAANAILNRLRDELRLDALNIKFLELQLLATFEDWSAIIALPQFASLCAARKTCATISILLEALYQTYVAEEFDKKNLDDLKKNFKVSVQPFVKRMSITVPPPGLRKGGWRLLALEVLTDAGRHDLLDALAEHKIELGWIADIMPTLTTKEREDCPHTTPLDTVRKAYIENETTDSLDRRVHLQALQAQLSPDERAAFEKEWVFAKGEAAVEETETITLPTSWVEWFKCAAEPDFINALEVASLAKDEWTIGPETGDPVAVQEFIDAIQAAQANNVANQRVTLALPYLVAWLQRDDHFPRSSLLPIYTTLLMMFALGDARGAEIYNSSQVLIEALLVSGPSLEDYHTLIASIYEIAGDGFGVDMVYWMLEIVEAFMNAATPDAKAREDFFHRVLARTVPIYGRLTQLQRVAINLLSSELGWSLPDVSAIDQTLAASSDKTLENRLAGLRVAIYSLTESASRQAKVALEKISASVTVETNADHGGTDRLRALAENSDIFVLNWLSAKHAATDFIRAHRGDKPLVYSQGKGFSSMLRAIEDFLNCSECT